MMSNDTQDLQYDVVFLLSHTKRAKNDTERKKIVLSTVESQSEQAVFKRFFLPLMSDYLLPLDKGFAQVSHKHAQLDYFQTISTLLLQLGLYHTM